MVGFMPSNALALFGLVLPVTCVKWIMKWSSFISDIAQNRPIPRLNLFIFLDGEYAEYDGCGTAVRVAVQ
jgi:hypothetical protein